MGKMLRIVTGLSALAMLSCLPVNYTKEQDYIVCVQPSHRRLMISNRNGGVQLEVSNDSLLKLHVTRRVLGRNLDECRARIDDIVVAIDSSSGDGITVGVTFPSEIGFTYAVDVRVNMPGFLKPDIASSNGPITIIGVVQSVRATTSNGTIALTDITGNVDAHTSNGRLELQRIKGSIDAVTSNGDAFCDVALPDSGGYCRIDDSNGKLRLEIPTTTSATIYARTRNANVHVSNLNIEYTRRENDLIEGKLGSGSNEIRLTTSNGALDLIGR